MLASYHFIASKLLQTYQNSWSITKHAAPIHILALTMKLSTSIIICTALPSVLGRSLYTREDSSIGSYQNINARDDSFISAREANPDDGTQSQLLELQKQLQSAANDPAAAQKIQQQMLDLMKKQQDAMAEGQKQQKKRDELERREAAGAPPPPPTTAQKELQDTIKKQNQANVAAQNKALAQLADATAKTPGAGVTKMTTTDGIVMGRELLERRFAALLDELPIEMDL